MNPGNRRGTCMNLRPYHEHSLLQGGLLRGGRFPSRGSRRDPPGHARPSSASLDPVSDPLRPDCNPERTTLIVQTRGLLCAMCCCGRNITHCTIMCSPISVHSDIPF